MTHNVWILMRAHAFFMCPAPLVVFVGGRIDKPFASDDNLAHCSDGQCIGRFCDKEFYYKSDPY
jgi:hypothetical protein